MKKYAERKAFLLSIFDNPHYYPFTPANDMIIELYAEFTGAKIDKLGRCNLLSRDFSKMYKDGSLKRYIIGNDCCVSQGKPKWSYIYGKNEN